MTDIGLAEVSRERKFNNASKRQYLLDPKTDKFLAIYSVGLIVHRLVRENTRLTKRAIYYQHVGLFHSQRPVDLAVDELAYM